MPTHFSIPAQAFAPVPLRGTIGKAAMRFQEHRSWGDLPFVQPCFDRPEFGTLPTLSPRFPFRGYRWPVVLSIVVGGLWALPFLFPSTAGIAWFIPGIVFLTAGSSTRLSPFQMGFLTGLYFHLTGLYWLLFMPVRVGALLGSVADFSVIEG